jgi:uncharacterized membrane protein
MNKRNSLKEYFIKLFVDICVSNWFFLSRTMYESNAGQTGTYLAHTIGSVEIWRAGRYLNNATKEPRFFSFPVMPSILMLETALGPYTYLLLGSSQNQCCLWQ